MTLWKNIFRRDNRVCPWWLSWTFDNPLRRAVQDPETIVGPYMRTGMTAADIGCGGGYFSVPLAKMAGETGTVFAVDLQQQMLDFVRRRAEKSGLASRIRLVSAAADDIGLKEPVDFVLVFWMAHEVEDLPRFFSQISAVLNTEGRVLIAEPRVHVTVRRFQKILASAGEAGFQVHETPPIRFSRAALLSK